jgi:hypothetical protein
MDRRALSICDPTEHWWNVKPGAYGIQASNSSLDLPLTGTVTIQE